MPDLRARFRDLDTLEVPDVLAQARAIGPRPPVEPGPRPGRRIAVAAFALLLAVASILYVARAFDRSQAPTPAHPQPSPVPSIHPTSCRSTATELSIPRKGAARLVAGTSTNDLWVVGSEEPWLDQYLVHYDGAHWTDVALPTQLNSFFSGDMAMAGPNDLWLLAPDGVARFDGTNWTRSVFSALEGLDQSQLELVDLEVRSPDDAWVTGDVHGDTAATSGPVILHWDGQAWSQSYGPSSGDAFRVAPARLVAVSAWGPDDVWAAGVTAARPSVPVALHWDGAAWSARPVLEPKVHAARIDTFGLVAVGTDEALMTTELGVVRWEGSGWVDTGFEAGSSMDVPLSMEIAGSSVWAKVWNTSVARWDGNTWQPERQSLYSYGMASVGDAAVFVGASGTRRPSVQISSC